MSNWVHVLIAVAAVTAFFSLLSLGASKTFAQHEEREARTAKQARRLAPPSDRVTPLLDHAVPPEPQQVRPVKLP